MKIVWKSSIDKKPVSASSISGKVFTSLREMEFAVDVKQISDKIITGDERFIPTVDGAQNPKEELLCLLKLASEIEHILLVQYLYAAYSIDDDTSEMKSSIVRIAIQEMGHLLGVQNLLLRVGGIENLHLHKSEIRTEIEFKLLPFTLEQLSSGLLAKYVAVEAPIDLINTDETIKKIRAIAVEKAGVSFNPVGGVYEKIFWLLQKDDNPPDSKMMQLSADDNFPKGWHVKDDDFIQFPEIQKYDSETAHWAKGPMQTQMVARAVIFEQLTTSDKIRLESLQLVNDIAVQGERVSETDINASHFQVFLSAYNQFNAVSPKILNIPTNPATRANPEFTTTSLITCGYSLLWAHFFNNLYVSLLLDIHASFFYKQFGGNIALRFVNLIRSNMTSMINTTTSILFKLPLTGEYVYNTVPRCGPAFELDNSFILPASRPEVDAMNTNSIKALRDSLDAIRKHKDFAGHVKDDSNIDGFLLTVESRYCAIRQNIISGIA